MWELLPSQIAALVGGLLDPNAEAVSLQMPTSAGKTSVCELLIFDEVKGRGRHVLFLVPFRALAAEIAVGMSGRLKAAEIEIIASYGGNLPTRSETTSLETADVLIVTPEKFSALMQVVPDLDKRFETVICDEGHLIDDDSRGLAASIDELLERTLAKHQSQSEAFKKTLHLVFRLRGTSLQKSIDRETWPVLKKSGASPRFWKAVNDAGLIKNSLWQTLEDPTDVAWRDEIVLPLLALTEGAKETPSAFLVQVIDGWLAGLTYAEIAAACKCNVEDVLEVMCGQIGFHLQESISKLSQLALAKHGEDDVSEMAQAWPSLLQFGLGTLQQLDLCERGATDRLAVWGIQRILVAVESELRGGPLVENLRRNGSYLRAALAKDQRVPELCWRRVCNELRIPENN